MIVRRLAILLAAASLTTAACGGKKTEGEGAAAEKKEGGDEAAGEGADKPAEGDEAAGEGADKPAEAADKPAGEGEAAAKGGQSTRQELIDAAIAAVQGGKPEAYLALMGDLALMKAACPEMMAKMAERGMDDAKLQQRLTKEQERVRKGIEECAKLDWKGARQIQLEGGEKKRDKPERGCTDIFELKDIRVTFELADKKKVTLKIDDPFTRGDTFFGVMGAPRCRVEGDKPETSTKPAEPPAP